MPVDAPPRFPCLSFRARPGAKCRHLNRRRSRIRRTETPDGPCRRCRHVPLRKPRHTEALLASSVRRPASWSPAPGSPRSPISRAAAPTSISASTSPSPASGVTTAGARRSARQSERPARSEGYTWRDVISAAGHATPAEVEIELRAQLDRARQFGVQFTHVDSHMGTLLRGPTTSRSTPRSPERTESSACSRPLPKPPRS